MKCQYCPHIETSQLICTANQLTGFYMRTTLALHGLNTGLQKHGRTIMESKASQDKLQQLGQNIAACRSEEDLECEYEL